MAFENLLVDDHGPVRVLTLNRPAKRNSFSVGLATDLSQGLAEANADANVRVVVVTGAGDSFSSGADMNIFAGGEASNVSVVANLQEPILAFHKPLIAAVNGTAVGMGVTLLPYFDMVYAAHEATFTTPFVKLGLVLEYGSSFMLPRLIGRQRTNEMILRGKPIDAATAESWGLVNRTFPKAELMKETLLIAADVAANGPNALQKSKQLIIQGEESKLQEAIQAELQILASCYGSEENMAAAMAFLEKKKR
jgi:enoyl-CoA hydratase/carnithine racemase